jgi:uncharacterized membrane protein
MNDVTSTSQNTSNVKIIYILFLASIVVGVTGLIGVVMAYINKDGDSGVANSHYRFQIRTFWISLLYCVISMVLMPVLGLGFLLLLATLVWYIVRCVKGLKALNENREPDNLQGWFF